jgi:hypothetical protein
MARYYQNKLSVSLGTYMTSDQEDLKLHLKKQYMSALKKHLGCLTGDMSSFENESSINGTISSE